MAKKELFKTKISNWFFRSMAAIPVNRQIHDSNAKSAAIEILNEGKVLGIFPEGTVNKTKGTKDEVDLLPFKFGAVSFASKTNAKIVPFAICGKYKMLKEKIYIIYGKPYQVGNDLEKENQILTEKVRKLKKKGDEIYEKQRK
jgi:1-acyl-sn-glycerol-3-phosphate acyltransferase